MPSRNRAFQPDREPLRDHSDLQLNAHRVKGPFNFLNPTQAHYTVIETTPTSVPNENGVSFQWTSRNNRKGRHTLHLDSSRPVLNDHQLPPKSNSPYRVLHNILRMFTFFPVWDVSWLVAFVFTLGSCVWVINAFFSFLPLIRPSSEFNDEVLYGGGITAFIGATVFEIGSIFLLIEAVNENRTGCFGWAIDKILKEHDLKHGRREYLHFQPSLRACEHHHSNKRNLVGVGYHGDKASDLPKPQDSNKSWVWFPPWMELRTHFFHELGFIASFVQLLAASIFWIAGLTALPGIYNHMLTGLIDGVYWTPQIIGGSGFIISGALFMIETQPAWWKPAPHVLGWHIGFWNLIGGVGFTLYPAFRYDVNS